MSQLIDLQRYSNNLPQNPHREFAVLQDLYWGKGLTKREMADVLGVHYNTIKKWMKKVGVPSRLVKTDIPENELREKYVDEELTQRECGEYFDVAHSTIGNKLDEYNIEKRSRSESCSGWTQSEEAKQAISEKMSGENHPLYEVTGEDASNWQGGVERGWRTTEKYRRIRWKAIFRDDEQCVECGEEDNLEVHHITPVYDGGEKYDLDNLVTLCEDCHIDVQYGDEE